MDLYLNDISISTPVSLFSTRHHNCVLTDYGEGLFMGLLVSFILLSILYVAISAVASLKVSYAAFDKEMGPSGQKKQAQ